MGRALVVAAAFALAACASGPRTPEQTAEDARRAQQVVDRARMTVENFQNHPDMGVFRDQVKRARGLLIVPEAFKAALIIGGGGGNAVLLARQESGAWNGPAFYRLGGISFGLQAGAEALEAIALIMTERGITKMLTPSVNLGADLSVAAGPVGAGAGAGTAGTSADVIVYSLNKGAYLGMSFQGSVLSPRETLNRAFYGKPVTATDILIRGEAPPAEAQSLLSGVRLVAGG